MNNPTKTVILLLILGAVALLISWCAVQPQTVQNYDYSNFPSYRMTWLYEQYITKQHICYSYELDKDVIISGDIKWFSMDDTRYFDYDSSGNKILFANINLVVSGDYLNCQTPKDNYFDEKAMDRVIYKNNL